MFSDLRFLFVFLVCLAVSAGLQAQEISLDPVTITSSLLEKRASETGRNITIIKGDLFNRSPVNSVDELLRYIPGLEVQARGPMGSQSDIVMRGGTYQQVLVMLDGIRLNDPNTGHFNSYLPIAPYEIDRIEVLKGAGSGIYGSEAVGGVVHIITKTFTQSRRAGGDTTAVEYGRSIGEYGLSADNLGGQLIRGKFRIAGGALLNRADGVEQRGTRGFFDNKTVSLSVGAALSDRWDVSLRSAYDGRSFSAQNFYTTFVSDTARERVAATWNQVQLNYREGNNRVAISGGYKHMRDRYLYNDVSTWNDNKSELWQGLVTWQTKLAKRWDLVAGLNYQNKEIRSNDRGNHRMNQFAPLVSLTYLAGSRLSLNPSVRLDWRENLGWEVVPQLNVSYRSDAFQWRGSAGKTIRDADFTERYNNYGKSLVTGGSVGNPSLLAERSLSYEVGADWFANRNLKLSATAFYRHHTDLIDFVTTAYANMPRKENLSPAGTFALAENVAKVNTRGAEVDLQYVHRIGAGEQLLVNLGTTFLDTKSSAATPSFYVSSHARFLANFSAMYQIERLSVSVNGLYKVRTPRAATAIEAEVSRAYFVCNVQAEYAMFRQFISAFVKVENLGDVRYSDLLGAVMPGRWLAGGMKFRVGR